MNRGAWLILVAAGRGVRLGRQESKAFVPLGDRPLLAYSLESAARSGGIEAVVVVGDPPRAAEVLKRLSPQARKKLRDIVAGGDTRRRSVQCGLSAVRALASPAEPTVLIHDCARPFASPELFDRVAREAVRGAVICARSIPDTVKEKSGDRVVATLERDTMVLAQTPQGAPLETLERAHAQSGDETVGDEAVGDDAFLLEALGETVRIVAGSSFNFKITTREDLDLAEAWVLSGGTPWMPA